MTMNNKSTKPPKTTPTTVEQAADKAYEAHANDEAGLALEPKKAQQAPAQQAPAQQAPAEQAPAEVKKEKNVSSILRDATRSVSAKNPQQEQEQPTYALDANDRAEVDMIAPPMDLFTLYNL